MQATYTILIYRDPNEPEGWLGHVPAVAAAHSFGDTREHAIAMVTEALEVVLEFFAERGSSFPPDNFDIQIELEAITDLLGAAPLDLEKVQVRVYHEVIAVAA